MEISETQRALEQLGFESHWSSSGLFLQGQKFEIASSKRILSAPIIRKNITNVNPNKASLDRLMLSIKVSKTGADPALSTYQI